MIAPTLTEMLNPVIDRTAELVKYLGSNPPGAVWLADAGSRQRWERIRTLLLARRQDMFLQVFRVRIKTDDIERTCEVALAPADPDSVEAASIALMMTDPGVQKRLDKLKILDEDKEG